MKHKNKKKCLCKAGPTDKPFSRGSPALFEKVDPRRRQEIADSMLINEDMNAFANCPSRPIVAYFDQNRFKYDSLSAGDPSGNDNEVHGW